MQWQILLTALSIGIFFRMLLRFFPLWLSVAGAISLLLQRGLIIFAHSLEPESLIIFLLLAFLYLIGSKASINHLLAGISLALMILVRPDFAFLIIIVPGFFLSDNPRTLQCSDFVSCMLSSSDNCSGRSMASTSNDNRIFLLVDICSRQRNL